MVLGELLYNLVFSNHLFLTTKTLASFPFLFRNDLFDNLDDYDVGLDQTVQEPDLDQREEIILDWRKTYDAIKMVSYYLLFL